MPIGTFDYIEEGHSGADYPSRYALKSDTLISSSTTADAFGSYAELISDTGDRPIIIEQITIQHLDLATKMVELELATGATSSEVPIYLTPTTLVDGSNTYQKNFAVSIWIPSGTRLSIRIRDSIAAIAYNYGCMLIYRKV